MATDAATAAATDPTTGETKRNAAIMQAYRLREVAFRFALDVAGVTAAPTEELCARARDFAAVVRAWSDADERARIARGRPLPGSLRPEKRPSKRKPARVIQPVRVSEPSPPGPPTPQAGAA